VPSRFEISDELWVEVGTLMPVRELRHRYRGRKAIDDRLALTGILSVLRKGAGDPALPRSAAGCGAGAGVV